MGSLEEAEEDDVFEEQSTDIYFFRSSLSKTLPEIFADKSALGYFIQYMDSRGCVNLIKFWLEVECLCGACLEKKLIESHNEENVGSDFNSLSSTLSKDDNFYCDARVNSLENHDNEELVLDKNVHNNDVKSNLELPKNNHVITEKPGSNCNFQNDSRRASTVRQDALRIYKKYFAKDVLGPNLITEELKSEMQDSLICESAEPLLRCLSLAQKIVYKILEDELVF